MARVEDEVFNCIKERVCELGYEIYDVEYVKEGANWYLRIYIDNESGISIEDCEKVSRVIDPMIDELNPIKTAYSLEVSSPGVERVLKKDEHFEKNRNKLVEVSLFKAVDKLKKIQGILEDFDKDNIVIEVNKKSISLERKNISRVKLIYEF